MSTSKDPDEMAHSEPSHLDLCCLHKPTIKTCRSGRVKVLITIAADSILIFGSFQQTINTKCHLISLEC